MIFILFAVPKTNPPTKKAAGLYVRKSAALSLLFPADVFGDRVSEPFQRDLFPVALFCKSLRCFAIVSDIDQGFKNTFLPLRAVYRGDPVGPAVSDLAFYRDVEAVHCLPSSQSVGVISGFRISMLFSMISDR